MNKVGAVWVAQDMAYRFSASPLAIGIVDRSDESRPPQVTAFRPERGEQRLREA